MRSKCPVCGAEIEMALGTVHGIERRHCSTNVAHYSEQESASGWLEITRYVGYGKWEYQIDIIDGVLKSAILWPYNEVIQQWGVGIDIDVDLMDWPEDKLVERFEKLMLLV